MLLVVAALVITVMLTVGAGAALAQAETVTTNERIPLSGETLPEDNPCTGELITWEGSLLFIVHSTFTPQGAQRGTNILQFEAHGVGASSGTEYVIKLSDHVQAIYDPDTGKYIQTNNTNQVWLSQGEGGDFRTRSVFHITQQPDGTYTSWVENFDIQCI
jgi:hypothetical protein